MEPTASSPPAIEQPSWWLRAGGGRECLQVAMPLVVSTLSWTILTFIDRMFLMWVSGAAMAAAFSAGALWFAILCIPLGICGFANTFVAQYYGDRQPEKIGAVVWQSAWIAVACAPMMAVAALCAPTVFGATGHTEEVMNHEINYFQILCIGGPAMWLCTGLSAFYSGRGLTRVNMWIDAGGSAFNAVLDYLLIFGHAGFPAMGVAGAAWATNATLWIKALIFIALLLRRRNQREFGTRKGLRFDRALCRRLLSFGFPSGAQMQLEVLGFTAFVMLVGRLGAAEFEATSLAFSISTLAFMPVWGIGLSASILVGQRLGENKPRLAERSTHTALQIALTYMGCVSLLYLFIPEAFLYGFFLYADYSPELRDEVYTMAINLLRFVAAYNMFDAVLMVFVNALKGAGDTRYILKASFVMAIALAALTWTCVEELQWGIYPCWAVVTVWVWGFGVIFWLRFRGGKWKSMRVIEQSNADAPAELETPEAELAQA
ncbi:MATE family efflux transporter [Pirellulales bacterium]|nr:MATE family efflux transporter [Pirellulales bacterium]